MQSLGEALVVVVAFFLPARADCSSALRGEVEVDGDEHVELEQDLAVQRRWLDNAFFPVYTGTGRTSSKGETR